MICSLFLVSCVGPQPNDEYVIAWAALKAAQKSNAPKFAAGYWSQAKEYYDQAIMDYNERDYAGAKTNFKRAIDFAEKSENHTLLKKAETGAVD